MCKMKTKSKALTFCDIVTTIPQFKETSWLNATLMAMFYSDGMRNVFSNHIARPNAYKNKTVATIVKALIDEMYTTTDAQYKLLYNELKPEKILEFFNKEDPSAFKKSVEQNVNVTYVHSLLHLLKMKENTVYFYTRNNKGLYFDYLNADTELDPTLRLYDPFQSSEAYQENIKRAWKKHKFWNLFIFNKLKPIQKTLIELKIISKTPEIICVRNDDSPLDEIYKHPSIFKNKTTHHRILQYHNKQLDTTITFEGSVYRLDSAIFSNTNRMFTNTRTADQIVAGVSCRGKRYVYNGWTGNNPNGSRKDAPCSLQLFNWFKDRFFCLSTTGCDLIHPNADDINTKQCFNGTKGNRIYFYVREDLIPKLENTILDDPTDSPCLPTQIINPKTGKCVQKNGAVGKQIMKDILSKVDDAI